MNTVQFKTCSDGKNRAIATVTEQPVARLAQTFVPAVLTSEVIRTQMADEGGTLSVKRAAAMACDLAAAMYAEFETRDWLINVPEDAF